jgi:bis(5'-nucleosyl)-tetraphosphatase (symmetrical)
VGDVQGCRAELEELLAAVQFDTARDRLEPTGDLVNRGPDSLGTLRVVASLPAQGVLGNHDIHLLRRARGLGPARPRDTLEDILAAPDRDALLAWLAAVPLVKAWPDVLLVHAGLNPQWQDPVAQLAGRDPCAPDDAVAFATRVRYCTADGQRPPRDDPPPGRPFRPWYEHWEKREPRTLVFGHWAARGLVHRTRVRGLDTGCVWGGRLTAWIAEDDRLVSVPARRAYATP